MVSLVLRQAYGTVNMALHSWGSSPGASMRSRSEIANRKQYTPTTEYPVCIAQELVSICEALGLTGNKSLTAWLPMSQMLYRLKLMTEFVP